MNETVHPRNEPREVESEQVPHSLFYHEGRRLGRRLGPWFLLLGIIAAAFLLVILWYALR